jgi:hypothetical protein
MAVKIHIVIYIQYVAPNHWDPPTTLYDVLQKTAEDHNMSTLPIPIVRVLLSPQAGI